MIIIKQQTFRKNSLRYKNKKMINLIIGLKIQ